MRLQELCRATSTSLLRLAPLDASHDEEDAHDRDEQNEARDDVVQDVVAGRNDAAVLTRREGCDRVVRAVVDGGEMHLGPGLLGLTVCFCGLVEFE